MPFDSVQIAKLDGAWGALGALIEADGSHGHPYVRKLTTGVAPLRDLADAVHVIGMLHGRHPGVTDYAVDHTRDPAATGWIETAAEGFAIERTYLVRLVAAAGPLPSTPGQAESEAAVAAQRHALDMLAQSDRAGCATGAALALVLDWHAIRGVLDTAAHRFGVDVPIADLPIDVETATLVTEIVTDSPTERAVLFGAQQMLAQHRGLWDLLEVRAGARHHQH